MSNPAITEMLAKMKKAFEHTLHEFSSIHRPGLTEEYIHGAQDKERPIGDIDITRFEFFIE